MKNPYLVEFDLLPKKYKRQGFCLQDNFEKKQSKKYLEKRDKMTNKYSFSVPTLEAVNTIQHYTKEVFDFGAGTGYWAYLLEQVNIKVRCLDIKKPIISWHNIQFDISPQKNEALMIGWPKRYSKDVFYFLKSYEGNIVIYVGEFMRGCGEAEFFNFLFQMYELQEIVHLPQWGNRSDMLYILTR